MRIILLLVAAAIVITGCATTPPSLSERKSAPQEQVLAFQNKTGSTSATVIVTRDAGYIASRCFLALSINNSIAARLKPTETATFYVEPGELLLRVGRDPMATGMCSMGGEDATQRESIVRAGETKAFRMKIDANGKTDIQRSDY